MIPIENSIAGRVADIHHLLPTSGLHIVGEHFLPIHFQLMSVADANLGTIRTSQPRSCARPMPKDHPQARAQGGGGRRHRGLRPRGRGGRRPARASLAPRLAAQVYGLKVLAEDVEDEAHNTTRFVILAKTPRWTRPAMGHGDKFRVPGPQPARGPLQGARRLRDQRGQHDEAGELYGRGPVLRHPVLRRSRRSSGGRAAPARAGGLQFFSRELHILGVFPAHPFRDQVREPAE